MSLVPMTLGFFNFTIILPMLLGISKLPVFVYSISPLPLRPLIMIFSWIACATTHCRWQVFCCQRSHTVYTTEWITFAQHRQFMDTLNCTLLHLHLNKVPTRNQVMSHRGKVAPSVVAVSVAFCGGGVDGGVNT